MTVGCTQPAKTEKRDPVILRIGVAVPKTGGPGAGVDSFASSYLLSEPLLGIGWDGRPSEKLATDPQWSDDGKTLSLRLRDDLRFHDGTPVKIEHARLALERSVERLSAQTVSFKNVTAVEIDKNDPKRILIRLSRPDTFLLTDLANVPVPHPQNDEIDVGPYKRIKEGPRTRFEAFGDYYRGRPPIDFIEAKAYEDSRTAWAALMRGEIDAVHEIAPSAMDSLKGQTVVNTFPFTRPYFISLFFNVRHPILKDPKVRQALSYAADRKAIIDLAMNGQGVVAEGPVWPFHWAYSTARRTYTRNIEAATLRLDSAGLRVKPGVAGGMPTRFRFTCTVLARDARLEKIALVLQKQLFEIGVDMQIEALPRGELMTRIQSGKFDAALAERTSGRALAWTYYFFHSSQVSLGYSAGDEPLDRLRTATGDGDVRKAVSDFQQILHDDPPAIFIAWPEVARVVSAKFVVPESKGQDVMSSLFLWKPADPGR